MPKIINELQWLNSKMNTSIKLRDIESILNFTLFWNLFEETYFGTEFSVSKISKLLQKKNHLKMVDETNEMLTFFQERYLDSGVLNIKYSSLELRDNDNPDLVERVITGREKDDCKKSIAIIIIISRFRNNLFHGIKEYHEVITQNEVFSYMNCYLSKIMDTI